jgi:hypothetical protein
MVWIPLDVVILRMLIALRFLAFLDKEIEFIFHGLAFFSLLAKVY